MLMGNDDYCGKESEVDALCCAECGTAFASVEASGTGSFSQPVSPAAAGPILGARAATLILLAYLAAQFTVGGLVGIVAGIASEIQQRAPLRPTESAKLKEKIILAIVIPAMVGGRPGYALRLSLGPSWPTARFEPHRRGMGDRLEQAYRTKWR